MYLFHSAFGLIYTRAAPPSGPGCSFEASSPKKLVTAGGSDPPDSIAFAASGLLAIVVEQPESSRIEISPAAAAVPKILVRDLLVFILSICKSCVSANRLYNDQTGISVLTPPIWENIVRLGAARQGSNPSRTFSRLSFG